MLSLIFDDEADGATGAMENALLARGALAPMLFRWEVRNALLIAVRRGRMQFASALERLDDIQAFPIELEPGAASSARETELEVAHRFGLSVYDAAYLDLAQRRSLPVMTRDARLAAAASELSLLWRPK